MNIWPFKKSYPSSVSPIQIEIFDAVQSGNEKRILSAIQKFDTVIQAEFGKWTTIPADIRGNGKWGKWYMEGLIGMADMFRRCGNAEYINKLMGNPDDNPIVRWNKAIVDGQAALGDGKPGLALTIIEPVISEVQTVSGNAVDKLLPVCLGIKGVACYKMGNLEDGISFTELALDMCRKSGDTEGVRTYTNNLGRMKSA